MHSPFLIQHVRVFDGTHVLPDKSVLIHNGLIAAITDNTIPEGSANAIDGTGRTLLPGLIDAHTHAFGPALVEALIFGVTTELDMFTDYRMVAEIKRQQAAGEGLDMADIFSAGTLATAPHGHGTEYGIDIPTLTTPEEAQDFVDARIAEGSDYIKIIYDNGQAYDRDISTITKATMAALVEAAHKRGKLAIVHALRYQDACDALEVGADGLAHLFIDAPAADFGAFVAAHHAFVIPTLTVLESICGTASGASLATDAHLDPYLSKWSKTGLQRGFSLPPSQSPRAYVHAQEAIRQLKAAGVPILVGTDAPNPGTAHGVSIHRELELLVQAGLTPLEALASVTSVTASIFSLPDRGRIAPDLRADLVLVDGDPTMDIIATRAIVEVWKQGVAADRQAYRATIAQQRKEDEERTAPVGSETGLVSDFTDGTASTRFGAGWDISTDSMRGGQSTAAYSIVEEGANGSRGALQITGTIAPALPFAWAGVNFYPGPTQWAPANLSQKTGISFWAKGDGKTYNIMIFSGSMMAMPTSVQFVASAEWQHYTFPFSQFGSVDSHEIMSIVFSGGPTPGPFIFEIDEVRFT